MNACTATCTSGRSCTARTQPNRQYCFAHDPDRSRRPLPSDRSRRHAQSPRHPPKWAGLPTGRSRPRPFHPAAAGGHFQPSASPTISWALRKQIGFAWWRRVDLNHRPTAYESAALPLSYAAKAHC